MSESKEPKWPQWSLGRVQELAAKRKGKRGEGVPLKVKKSLPCVHVGDKLTMKEIEEAKLNPRRRWHFCKLGMAKNELKIPGIACACSGCNAKCEKYEEEKSE